MNGVAMKFVPKANPANATGAKAGEKS
jgi:hypothetical protein